MSGNRSRWLVVAIAFSVLLNLFLAGIIIGRLSFPAVRPGVVAAASAIAVRERVRALPMMEKIRFGFAMRRHASELRSARDRLRVARHAAEMAITASNYDEATVKARLADVRAAVTAQQKALHDALADALGTLSVSSRTELVAGTK